MLRFYVAWGLLEMVSIKRALLVGAFMPHNTNRARADLIS